MVTKLRHRDTQIPHCYAVSRVDNAILVLDTTDMEYTFYARDKTKETKNKLKEKKREKEK